MPMKEYKSLAWIHRVREENFAKTKSLPPRDLISKTKEATEHAAKVLGLKIVQPKEQVR